MFTPPRGWEILIILVIVLIIFGAGKLPQAFRSAGQGLREFRMAREGEFDEDKPGKKPVKKTAKKTAKKTEEKPKRQRKSAKKA